MEIIQYDSLLNQYRAIWHHRLLEANLTSEEILKEAISRELKDENSHPRIRKSIYEKYYYSTKRLLESSISEEARGQLLALHLEIMKNLVNQHPEL